MRNNTLQLMEKATAKYTQNTIKSAIKANGTDCILYRLKKDRVADQVYGIHGGTDLSRTPSTSIYDKPISYENIDDIDLFKHETGEATNFDLTESIDDSYDELVVVKVLLNTMTWRAISQQSDSLLEDPGYIYCLSEVIIEHGDVLVVNKPELQLKFKAYFPEKIGNSEFIIYRFKITNVQE